MLKFAWSWITLNKKLVAVILAFLVIIGYILYNSYTISSLREDLTNTSTALEQSKKQIDTLTTGYNKLVDTTNKMQVDLNRYNLNLQQSEAKYETALKTISNLKSREGEAKTNPTKLSNDLKEEVAEYEREFECVTGKLSSCSSY